MFSLTRSNLLRQLPDLNEIIRRFLEIVTVSNSITPKADKSEHIFGDCYDPNIHEKNRAWSVSTPYWFN
jgi:hypothetical protein